MLQWCFDGGRHSSIHTWLFILIEDAVPGFGAFRVLCSFTSLTTVLFVVEGVHDDSKLSPSTSVRAIDHLGVINSLRLIVGPFFFTGHSVFPPLYFGFCSLLLFVAFFTPICGYYWLFWSSAHEETR